jgi:large subunit ribosomal protein L18
MKTNRKQSRVARHRRVRAKVTGTAAMPRLNIFRSLTHVYLQVIDDEAGKTLVAASTKELKTKSKKSEAAMEAGKKAAEKALAAGIKQVVFDRGGYKYHGRVKSAAEGARAGGLKF